MRALAAHGTLEVSTRSATSGRQFILVSALTIVGFPAATVLAKYFSAARDLSNAAREALRLPAPKHRVAPLAPCAQSADAGMPHFLTNVVGPCRPLP